MESSNSNAVWFLQEEQKQRRAEIEHSIARIAQDQRLGLILTGAVWAWMAVNGDKVPEQLKGVIEWLPGLLMGLFFWRWTASDKLILRIAGYTQKLEQFVQLPPGLGWESQLDDKRRKEGFWNELTLSNGCLWIGLLVVNFVLAMFTTQLFPWPETATGIAWYCGFGVQIAFIGWSGVSTIRKARRWAGRKRSGAVHPLV